MILETKKYKKKMPNLLVKRASHTNSYRINFATSIFYQANYEIWKKIYVEINYEIWKNYAWIS